MSASKAGKKKTVNAYDPVYKKWATSKTVLIYPNDHCSTIHNSQDMEATYVSTDRWLDKEDMLCVCTCACVYIHNGILFSLEKKWNILLCYDMNKLWFSKDLDLAKEAGKKFINYITKVSLQVWDNHYNFKKNVSKYLLRFMPLVQSY